MSVTPITDEAKAAARTAIATIHGHIVDDGDTALAEAEETAVIAFANAAMAAGFNPLAALYDAVSADGSRNPIAERHRVAV